MSRNWASRSGWRAPSRDFAGACSEWSLPLSAAAGRSAGCTGDPAQSGPPARWRRLLVVHRSGDSGSPRVESATSPSSAGSSPGSVTASFFRPPPGRRTRPGGAVPPEPSSAAPSATVCHDAPVIRATAPAPPSPAARATAPSTSSGGPSHPVPEAAAPAPGPSRSAAPRSQPDIMTRDTPKTQVIPERSHQGCFDPR